MASCICKIYHNFEALFVDDGSCSVKTRNNANCFISLDAPVIEENEPEVVEEIPELSSEVFENFIEFDNGQAT